MTVTAVGAMSVLRAESGAAAAGTAAGAPRTVRRSGFTIAADGSYAACLAEGVTPDGAGRGLLVERWTLGGPEPYAVPLPGRQPEEADTQVLPLADGRVLVRRRVADRWDLVLLHPSGPETGSGPELLVGSLTGDDVRLLPPVPASPPVAYALAYDAAAGRTGVWRVHGTTDGQGPQPVMTVEGRCTGGVWLDRSGRLLALDRELGGRTKAVAADLDTGRTNLLLQITDDSDDRLLLADPDSGLLVLRSDATGEARLGWGVLGSRHPVRFPDALRVPGVQLTPVAAQPGLVLAPEASVVAFRAEVPGGAESLALWRPGERRLHWRASPVGWLGAAGVWLAGEELKLPYAAGALGAGAPAGAAAWGLAAYEPPVSWGVAAPAWGAEAAGAPGAAGGWAEVAAGAPEGWAEAAAEVAPGAPEVAAELAPGVAEVAAGVPEGWAELAPGAPEVAAEVAPGVPEGWAEVAAGAPEVAAELAPGGPVAGGRGVPEVPGAAAVGAPGAAELRVAGPSGVTVRGAAGRRELGVGGSVGAVAGVGGAASAGGAAGAGPAGGAAGPGPAKGAAGAASAAGAALGATPCASAASRGARAFAGCAGGRVLLPVGGRGGGGRAPEQAASASAPGGECGRALPVRRAWAVLPLQQAPLAAAGAS